MHRISCIGSRYAWLHCETLSGMMANRSLSFACLSCTGVWEAGHHSARQVPAPSRQQARHPLPQRHQPAQVRDPLSAIMPSHNLSTPLIQHNIHSLSLLVYRQQAYHPVPQRHQPAWVRDPLSAIMPSHNLSTPLIQHNIQSLSLLVYRQQACHPVPQRHQPARMRDPLAAIIQFVHATVSA